MTQSSILDPSRIFDGSTTLDRSRGFDGSSVVDPSKLLARLGLRVFGLDSRSFGTDGQPFGSNPGCFCGIFLIWVELLTIRIRFP